VHELFNGERLVEKIEREKEIILIRPRRFG
jgi:hypothetical protein